MVIRLYPNFFASTIFVPCCKRMAQSGWVSVLFIFFFIIGDKRGIEPRHLENYQNHIAQTCFAVFPTRCITAGRGW